jgi:hypothetical protein
VPFYFLLNAALALREMEHSRHLSVRTAVTQTIKLQLRPELAVDYRGSTLMHRYLCD